MLKNSGVLLVLGGALLNGCSGGGDSGAPSTGGSGGSGSGIGGMGGSVTGGAGGAGGTGGVATGGTGGSVAGGATSGGTGGVTTGASGGSLAGGASAGGTGGVAAGATGGSLAGGIGGVTTGATGGSVAGGSGGVATGGTSGITGGASGGGTGGVTTGGTGGGVATGPLLDRLGTTEIAVPEGVEAGVRGWRIWGRGDLNVAPVFSVPLSNCGTLVCYTTDSGSALTARVAVLDASDQLVSTITVGPGLECRGLAAEDDGHFAALVWDNAADRITVSRFDLTGAASWSEELTNSDNIPDEFTLGESRLEYGAGRYGAYYHVHSDSGHEGDTLKWVDAATGAESTEWTWGCSHSMSNLLRYSPGLSSFLPVCVTDCYPGTDGEDFATVSQGGIYLNHDESKVLDVDAGCNGDVAGEVGSAALTPDGWMLVFNAHQNPMTVGQESYDPETMNQDVGLSRIAGDLAAGGVVWLTSTPAINEADTSIARWQPSDDSAEQYLVGWAEPGASYVHRLARIDAAGNLIEGPHDVSSLAQWGRRDDPFRTHSNGDVVWAWFDAPGATTLHLARLRSGGSATCAGY